MLKRETAIGAVRIDGGNRFGKKSRYFMMIQNNRVDAFLPCVGNRFMVRYAAIHGNDQTDPLRVKPLHRLPVQTVPLCQPVWNVIAHIRMNLPEKLQQYDNSSDSVGIIITVDDHLLFEIDRTDKPVDRFTHILHQERIVKILERRGEIAAGGVRITYITAFQDAGDQRTQTQFPNQQPLNFIVFLPKIPAGRGKPSCVDHFL